MIAKAAPEVAVDLTPNVKELRALRLFVSADETRFSLSKLWRYTSEDGLTYVATDGHTIAVRRSGAHRTMVLGEIRKLDAFAVDEYGAASASPESVVPPAWDQVLRAHPAGKLAPAYGFDPSYMARIADVERAAGWRAADDFRPARHMSKKDLALEKAHLRGSAYAVWNIPSDPLDGWFWHFETAAALWEGVVMPRRV